MVWLNKMTRRSLHAYSRAFFSLKAILAGKPADNDRHSSLNIRRLCSRALRWLALLCMMIGMSGAWAQQASIDSITATPNPLVAGQPLTLFAQTTNVELGQPATWNVDGVFYMGAIQGDGSTGFNISGGTTANWGAGTHTVTLSVSNIANSQASQSIFLQSVAPLSVTSANPSQSVAGAQYAQTNSASGGFLPYTYAISSGTVPAGTSLDTSTGTVSGTPTTAGPFSYTVTVTDGSNATASTSTIAGTISLSSPGLSLATSGTAVTFGTPTILTATVSSTGSATGNVTFREGSTVIGTSSLTNNVATLTTSFMTGTHTITAIYSGDANNATATSSSVVITVTTTPVLTLTASSTTAAPHTPITFTATLTAAASPTGTIAFKDGSTVLGTVTLSGVSALFTTSVLDTGTHNITAVYSGDANNPGATSSAVAINISRADPAANAVVRAATAAQVSSSLRFAQAQVQNLTQRLESLHDESDLPGAAPGYGNTSGSGAGSRSGSNAMATARSEAILLAQADPPGSSNTFSLGGLSSALPHISPAVRLWMAGSVNTGRTSAADNSGSKFSTSGVTLGADTRITPDLALGLSAGIGADRTRFDNSGSTTDGRSYTGSIYGSWRFARMSYLDLALSYGSLRFAMDRWSDDGSVMLNGVRHGNALSGSVGLSTGVAWGAWRVNPYVRVDTTRVALDAYRETGSADWALAYDHMRTTTVTTTGGTRVSYTFDTAWGLLTPGARVAYQHTSGGSYIQQLGYADVGGYGYAFGGTTTEVNTMLYGLSLSLMARNGLSLGLQYLSNGDFGGSRSEQWQATVQMAF